jgi:hypothetical protein
MHHKISVSILVLGLLVSLIQGQTGIGAAGTLNYPGLSASDLYHSRFGAGGGYEFFARHKLIQFSPDILFHARYSYRRYYNAVNLPYTSTTRFDFTYLSISVLCPVKQSGDIVLYGGGGLNLATINGGRDYLKVTNVSLIPDIISGAELYLSKNYNIFSEVSFQFGSVPVRADVIPLNGLRFSIGVTMFLINEE